MTKGTTVRRLGMAGALAMGAWRAEAQIPERFTNLQVLAKDTSRKDLVGTMRGWTSALGVRCGHCHEGGNPDTLEGVDFASDAKWEKRAARVMARMVSAIAENHLQRLEARPLAGGAAPPAIRVECATCHRGLARPESIESVMERAVGAEGIEAAVATYRQLRTRYLAKGSYDFSQGPLNTLAERLIDGARGREAAVLLEMSAEYNPDAPWLFHLLGEARLSTGDRGRALEAFERALALNPQNPLSRKRVDELKAPAAAKP
jgi:tetratricopeptide (TPR) repeat protein